MTEPGSVNVTVSLTVNQARQVLRTEPWQSSSGHSAPLDVAETAIKVAIRRALEEARVSPPK